jgi:hypothetical protein
MKLNKLVKGEKGQALMIVALLMLVSALVIAPVLAHVSTGLKTGKEVYEEKMQLFYAADSGIEDGLWQVDNERLEELEFYPTDPTYNPYAYYAYDGDGNTYEWHYDLPAYVEDQLAYVNGKDTTVTIQNIWIPKDIDAPSPSAAKDIIEGTGGNPPKLMITGGVSAASTYQIGITYYYDSDEDPGGANLTVSTIGIWLPPGFGYVDDSCSLGIEPATPVGYCSGLAVIWSFAGGTTLASFPGSTGYPLERSFTFEFSGPASVNPGAALAWINTSDGYTWNADVKVYRVASTATEDSYDPDKTTTVEAYTAVGEIRELGSSVSGDYVAIGNSLITGNPDYRGQLLKESSATIQDSNEESPGYIPPGATVEAAYLYWSGFIDHFYWTRTTFGHGHHQYTMWSWSADPNNWYVTQDNGTGLVYDPDNLQQMVEGWTDDESKGARVNTVNFGTAGNMQDIATHDWQVWPKTNDSPACWYYTCLYDATDLVKQPVEDAIKAGGSGSCTFTLGHANTVVNQLRPDFPYEPDDNVDGNYYSFTLCDSDGDSTSDYTGYPLGTPAHMLPWEYYYHGRYNASYAGWSLVIIYSSPETEGHQLYLYDISSPNFTFRESYPEGASESNPDFDGDGNPGGLISGFLVPQPIDDEANAAKITCFVGEGDEDKTGDSFKVTGPSGSGENLPDGTGADLDNVWNSTSVGVTASGIDIDTFYVTWGSTILEPNNTWAQVDIPTVGDGFTLSYIILSFRSSITSGGTLSYLVRG